MEKRYFAWGFFLATALLNITSIVGMLWLGDAYTRIIFAVIMVMASTNYLVDVLTIAPPPMASKALSAQKAPGDGINSITL